MTSTDARINLGFTSLQMTLTFSGFLQFKGNFVDAQNNSKYRDCTPLNCYKNW